MQRVVDIKINTISVYLVGHGFTEIALQLDNFFKVISQSSLILSREYMIQKGNYINWCPEIRPLLSFYCNKSTCNIICWFCTFILIDL